MRALLVFNPQATSTDEAVRELITSALSSELDLEVAPTKQRGHATHVVAGAVHDEVETVFALGGDGTANEVIQALAGTGVRLGIIPGGGANVLARSLGLPRDPVTATSQLLDAVRTDRTRMIGLGRAGTRYFGFNAGFGFDAAVVRHVEQHARMKRTLRQAAFVWSALREWTVGTGRGGARITVEIDGEATAAPATITMVANTSPYTYLGRRPLLLHPTAAFETGLDLLTVAQVSNLQMARIALRALRAGRLDDLDAVASYHDLGSVTVRCPDELPLMVDGDYAGEFREVRFTAVPRALRVLT